MTKVPFHSPLPVFISHQHPHRLLWVIRNYFIFSVNFAQSNKALCKTVETQNMDYPTAVSRIAHFSFTVNKQQLLNCETCIIYDMALFAETNTHSQEFFFNKTPQLAIVKTHAIRDFYFDRVVFGRVVTNCISLYYAHASITIFFQLYARLHRFNRFTL